ncbi:unnamed protein product [Knipowitschia caucasica]
MASLWVPEEQLQCSICLELFSDPVTTPCGHSFCRLCLSRHWDQSLQCLCPLCNQDCRSRPPLHLNVVLSHMVSQCRGGDHREREEGGGKGEGPGWVPPPSFTPGVKGVGPGWVQAGGTGPRGFVYELPPGELAPVGQGPVKGPVPPQVQNPGATLGKLLFVVAFITALVIIIHTCISLTR